MKNQNEVDPQGIANSMAGMAIQQMIEDHGNATTEVALLLVQSRAVIDAIMGMDAPKKSRVEVAVIAARMFSEVFTFMHENVDELGDASQVIRIASAIMALMEADKKDEETSAA